MESIAFISRFLYFLYSLYWFLIAFLVVQMVKTLPAMRDTQVQSLGQEDSLGEGNG